VTVSVLVNLFTVPAATVQRPLGSVQLSEYEKEVLYVIVAVSVCLSASVSL